MRYFAGMGERVVQAWSAAWSDRDFRRRALGSAVGLVLVLTALAHFLSWVERRPGVVLPDPLLNLLTPHDLTWLTFALIYAALIATVARLADQPRMLVLGLQAYALMALLRMAAMSLAPLEAPPQMIPLLDPLVEAVSSGTVLTKDLFFSGHTSTMFLFFLLARGRWARTVFLAGTLAVAVCVLEQHVHYSVDVLVAPLFANAAYEIAQRLSPGAAKPLG